MLLGLHFVKPPGLRRVEARLTTCDRALSPHELRTRFDLQAVMICITKYVDGQLDLPACYENWTLQIRGHMRLSLLHQLSPSCWLFLIVARAQLRHSIYGQEPFHRAWVAIRL